VERFGKQALITHEKRIPRRRWSRHRWNQGLGRSREWRGRNSRTKQDPNADQGRAVKPSSRGFYSDSRALRGSGLASQLLAIGICAPGPLNPETGVIINPPNPAIWHNYPLAEEMRRPYQVPVQVDNDANAAALAEAKWGAGRGYRNFL